MDIILGSGNNRVIVKDVPSGKTCDKVVREQTAEDLKAYLFRPQTLGARNRYNGGGHG